MVSGSGDMLQLVDLGNLGKFITNIYKIIANKIGLFLCGGRGHFCSVFSPIKSLPVAPTGHFYLFHTLHTDVSVVGQREGHPTHPSNQFCSFGRGSPRITLAISRRYG